MGNNSELKYNIENANEGILSKDKVRENLEYFKRALEEVMANKIPVLVDDSRGLFSEADNACEKGEP